MHQRLHNAATATFTLLTDTPSVGWCPASALNPPILFQALTSSESSPPVSLISFSTLNQSPSLQHTASKERGHRWPPKASALRCIKQKCSTPCCPCTAKRRHYSADFMAPRLRHCPPPHPHVDGQVGAVHLVVQSLCLIKALEVHRHLCALLRLVCQLLKVLYKLCAGTDWAGSTGVTQSNASSGWLATRLSHPCLHSPR